MNWSEKTSAVASIQARIDANENERITLRDEYNLTRNRVGCEHPTRHHYTVAAMIPRFGCCESDRELAETIRGERN